MIALLLLISLSFSAGEWKLTQLDKVIEPAHETSTVEVAALNDTVLFAVKGSLAADFSTFNPVYGRVDIYEPSSGLWTFRNLSFGSSSLASASDDASFAIFGGGWTSGRYRSFTFLDVYDNNEDSWTPFDLDPENGEDPREGFTLAIVGNIGLVAGGYDANYGGPIFGYYGDYESRVDLLNLDTKQWIGNASLSAARSGMAAATVGNTTYFAGGLSRVANTDTFTFDVTWYSVVDVYDATTNTWSTIELPHNATNLKSAVSDDLIAFIGGQTVNDTQNPYVQIYNTTSNTWEVIPVPQTEEPYLAATSLNNHFVFARASGLDILSIDSWTFVPFISGNRSQIGAGSTSEAAYFATVGQKVEVLTFDSSNGTSSGTAPSSTSSESSPPPEPTSGPTPDICSNNPGCHCTVENLD